MAKIIDITIINSNTLKLNTDAYKGDEIDLLSLGKIDNTMIIKKIEEETDKEYQRRLDQLKEKFNVEKENAVLLATEDLKKQLTQYKQQLETKGKEVTSELALKHQEEKSKLEKEISELKNSINNKEVEIRNIKAIQDKDIEIAISNKEKEFNELINSQKEEISNLRLAKSFLSVKKIGEELENWCNNEYTAYSQSGFQTCTWDKDNTSIKEDGDIKGTKADYIFKVYANEEKKDDELLASVACEMKSEDPNSVNKKKNSDHYAKLDKDRKKKKCEYALLISELEWEQANDVPIKKVNEYEKMYVVRPQYFITFLSIITALGMKYKEILLESNKEIEQFKENQEILDEFEKMKSDILDKPLKKLETEIKTISDNVTNIMKCSEKIISSTENITSSVIETIKRKIEGFNITKVTKKIKKLSEQE